MKTRRCSGCGKIKSVSEFHKNKTNKDGFNTYCMVCARSYGRQYHKNNSKLREGSCRNWRDSNKEHIKQYNRKYHKDNAEYYRQYKEDNPEKTKEQQKKCERKRILIPKNKLNNRFSRAINHSLKGNKNGIHWENLVEYTLGDLMLHLEKLFQLGMSWNNYGKFGWHIDHIIPQSLWEFESYSDREFKQCWALCNLQPLWAYDNISKGNKVIYK